MEGKNSKEEYIDNKNAPELLYPIISKDILSLEALLKLIILCIGTDRSAGDSLGPLTGTLKQYDITSNHWQYT